jgi:hypothetical protein
MMNGIHHSLHANSSGAMLAEDSTSSVPKLSTDGGSQEEDGRVSPRSVTASTTVTSESSRLLAPTTAFGSHFVGVPTAPSSQECRMTPRSVGAAPIAGRRRLVVRNIPTITATTTSSISIQDESSDSWIIHHQDSTMSCSYKTLQNVYEASTAQMWQRIQNSRCYPNLDWSAVLQDNAEDEQDEEEEPANSRDFRPEASVNVEDLLDDAVFELEL